jgi:dihydropteroate synthase
MDKLIRIQTRQEAREELQKINVSTQGISAMEKKFFHFAVKLHKIENGAANILKQEMLRLGGDAAIARGIVEGKVMETDVILLGDLTKMNELLKRLNYYQIFDLENIQKRIEKLIFPFEKSYSLQLSQISLSLSPVKIMGILNVTDDSFSDGGKFVSTEKAFLQAKKMIIDGADIIDIGGESTRPDAISVSPETEIDRVVPLIKKIREYSSIPISVDTTKAVVAEQSIIAGADIINDISALRFDDEMLPVLKRHQHIPIILMHMQGTPQTMQKKPYYDNTITEILNFFQERISFCQQNGINKERIIIDPGIGFGKRQIDNLLLLKHLEDFHLFRVPVLLGASRKSFLGHIYTSTPQDRLEGSLAATALAYQSHLQIVRVHDVLPHKRFIQTLQAIKEVS